MFFRSFLATVALFLSAAATATQATDRLADCGDLVALQASSPELLAEVVGKAERDFLSKLERTKDFVSSRNLGEYNHFRGKEILYLFCGESVPTVVSLQRNMFKIMEAPKRGDRPLGNEESFVYHPRFPKRLEQLKALGGAVYLDPSLLDTNTCFACGLNLFVSHEITFVTFEHEFAHVVHWAMKESQAPPDIVLEFAPLLEQYYYLLEHTRFREATLREIFAVRHELRVEGGTDLLPEPDGSNTYLASYVLADLAELERKGLELTSEEQRWKERFQPTIPRRKFVGLLRYGTLALAALGFKAVTPGPIETAGPGWEAGVRNLILRILREAGHPGAEVLAILDTYPTSEQWISVIFRARLENAGIPVTGVGSLRLKVTRHWDSSRTVEVASLWPGRYVLEWDTGSDRIWIARETSDGPLVQLGAKGLGLGAHDVRLGPAALRPESY
jgi:hypothetical protein